MAQLLFKNNGAGILEVPDLGIYLNASEELDLLTNFRNEDIIESTDIQTSISGDGQVTLVDGASTILSYSEMIDYLTALTRYDKIDFTYISGKDDDTDVTGAELESLTDGSDVTLHNHDNRYYNKTELQTSGSSAVHWNNITNAPQFGALSWKTPVDRTDSSYGSGTALPVTGNQLNDARMVADDGDGKPAQYVCVATSGTWDQQWTKIADVDWGASNSINVTAANGISSTNVQDALYELQGEIDNIISGNTNITHSLDDAYNDGSIITVDSTDVSWQLSDSRSFVVTADAGTKQVFKVAAASAADSVTINGNFEVNGATVSLDATSASNFSVTGNNLTLSTLTSGNVVIASAADMTFDDQYLASPIALSESGVTGLDARFSNTSIIGALNETLDIASGNNTLDDAYDGVTENGAGRTITVDSGSVQLDATGATFAPIELTEISNAPTSGLAAGQLAFINGALYNYDGVRSKWLSVDEQHFDWADNVAKGKYLPIGGAIGNQVGFKIPVNATITKVTARVSGGNTSRELQLRKNGVATSIKTFSLAAGEYTSTNDNINIVAGDYLQVFVSGGSGQPVKDIVVSVYLRWRV